MGGPLLLALAFGVVGVALKECSVSLLGGGGGGVGKGSSSFADCLVISSVGGGSTG